MKTDLQLVTLSSLLVLSAFAVGVGCKRPGLESDTASTSSGRASSTNDSNRWAASENRANATVTTNQPDNTRINVRDRDDSALTAGDQGETEADRDLTRQIRKSLMGDEKLSASAKNVKIITRDRKVTLRGPVSSEEEKTAIETMAKSAAGEGNVTVELEVKKQP